MPPSTRAKNAYNILNFQHELSLETIHNTLDPIQKTFRTDFEYLPFWRFVLYQRYVGDYQPPGMCGELTNYGILHCAYPSSPVNTISPIPSNLQQSAISIRLRSNRRQLLKITLYFTTGTIMVQGAACLQWVEDEFSMLQAVVHTMASNSRDPLELTQGDKVAPCQKTALKIMATTASPSVDDLTPVREALSPKTTSCELSSARPIPLHFSASFTCRATSSSSDDSLSFPAAAFPEPSDANDQQAHDNNFSVSDQQALEEGSTVSNQQVLEKGCIVSDLLMHEDSCTVSDQQVQEENSIVSDHQAQEESFTVNDQQAHDQQHLEEIEHENLNCAAGGQLAKDKGLVLSANTETQTDISGLLTFKTMISDELELFKTKLNNSQRVHNQEQQAIITDLETKCLQQDEIIKSLQRKCQSFEQALKDLKLKVNKTSPVASHTKIHDNLLSSNPAKQVMDNCCNVSQHADHSIDTSSPIHVNHQLNNDCSESQQEQNHFDIPFSSTLDSHVVNLSANNQGVTQQIQSKAASTSSPARFRMGRNSIKSQREPCDASLDTSSHSHTLRIPVSAQQLIIGDSNLRYVNTKRLDPKKNTSVKTFHGATISSLTGILQSASPMTSLKKVVIHVGSNDAISSKSSQRSQKHMNIEADYNKLISTAQTAFPNAEIALSAIPPQKPWGNNRVCESMNVVLSKECNKLGVCFIAHNPLWSKKDNKLNPRILRDKIHLSQTGLGLFLREIKIFLNISNFNEARVPSFVADLSNTDHFPPLPKPQKGSLGHSHDLHSEFVARPKHSLNGQSVSNPVCETPMEDKSFRQVPLPASINAEKAQTRPTGTIEDFFRDRAALYRFPPHGHPWGSFPPYLPFPQMLSPYTPFQKPFFPPWFGLSSPSSSMPPMFN